MSSEFVRLIDVTLRDGIQGESEILPSKKKIELVKNLVRKGLKEIQLTSFVHPRRVPQMADAELLIKELRDCESSVVFSALVLNEVGLDRAIASGIQKVDLSLSCSHTHSLKNTGLGLTEAIQTVKRMLEKARNHGLRIRIGLQCVFGCKYEGAIPVGRALEVFNSIGLGAEEELSLADSTGDAYPALLREVVNTFGFSDNLVLHLHNTKGLGLLNLYAALELGIRAFDTSLGGLGGCPYIPGAGGNIATEDASYLLEKLGYDCGFSSDTFFEETSLLEEMFGSSFSSSMYKIHKKERNV